MDKSDLQDDTGRENVVGGRPRQRVTIKRKKVWSFRRVISIIGFTAAFFAVISLISPVWQARVIGTLMSGYEFIILVRVTLNEFLATLIPFPQLGPIQGLGDVILLAALIIVIVLLFRLREPAVTSKIDEMIIELKVRSKVTQRKSKADSETSDQSAPMPPAPYIAYVPMGYPQQPTAAPSKILQLSASAIVNAPRGKVWEMLSEVIYVPTCQQLLDTVEVLGKVANAITWEGKVRTGRKSFPVEGTTTLFPPTRMEVVFTRGALQGFRGALSLSEVPEGTRLTETAEFDPSSLPEEYSPVASALRTRGSEILVEDLQHFDRLIRALMSSEDQEGLAR
ncbi:MAG: SRPBCC family protein [Thermoplasmata archaeon]